MNRSLTLNPTAVLKHTDELGPREFGVLMRLALSYWETDQLPGTPAAIAKATGIGIETAKVMQPRLMPYFEGSAFFAILHDVSIARYARRAKAGRLGGLRMKSGGGGQLTKGAPDPVRAART